MFWIEIIGIILAFVIFKLWGNSYDGWNGTRYNKEFRKEDKLKRPLWGVILLFIIALIPIVNLFVLLVILGLFVKWILEEDLYFYSNSNIFKWLNKDI
jgi:hypothetical protein